MALTILKMVIKILISLGIFTGGFQLAKAIDASYLKELKKYSAGTAVTYIFFAALLLRRDSWILELLDSFYWGTMAFAAFCDYNTKEVYDFCYLPALLSGGIFLISGHPPGIMDLVLFCLVQWIIFRKLYGEADCLAFCICAAYLTAYGGGLIDYILLMAIVFILLTIIQFLRRNIAGNGNLKEGVPLIPYIAAVMLVLTRWKWR